PVSAPTAVRPPQQPVQPCLLRILVTNILRRVGVEVAVAATGGAERDVDVHAERAATEPAQRRFGQWERDGFRHTSSVPCTAAPTIRTTSTRKDDHATLTA